jgi:hypothetical protein
MPTTMPVSPTGFFRYTLFFLLSACAIAGIKTSALPTYRRDVAPILYENCAVCHRPGEVAPFPLLTYEDARKRAALIATVTRARVMPPWHAETGVIPFQGVRRLTDEQIEVLRQWAAAGAPEGADEVPQPPQFPQGWQAGMPDLVVPLPQTFRVPADGPDIYHCQVVPLNFSEDRYVRVVEFHPGGRRVVHHSLMFIDTAREARAQYKSALQQGYGCFGGPGIIPTGILSGWAPGSAPEELPGTAVRIPKGADLIVQIHYHPSGKEEEDHSVIGLTFAKKPQHEPYVFGMLSSQIDIPPGERHYEVHESSIIPADVNTLGIAVHAHLLCREIDAEARLPDGSTLPLIRVPQWDFNWQGVYWFEKPVRLPRGTSIAMHAVYDNSEENPRNPSHPPRRITFGEQTTDEMALLAIPLTLANESDAADFRRAMGMELLSERIRSGDIAQIVGFPKLQFVLRLFDRNHDGRLDTAEQRRFMRFARVVAVVVDSPVSLPIQISAVLMVLLFVALAGRYILHRRQHLSTS